MVKNSEKVGQKFSKIQQFYKKLWKSYDKRENLPEICDKIDKNVENLTENKPKKRPK